MFFGVWSDPDAALRKYLDEVDKIQAGRDPRKTGVVWVSSTELSAYDLCNLCFERQQRRADSGEVTRRNFSDNLNACRRFMGHFAKFTRAACLRAADFTAEEIRSLLKASKGWLAELSGLFVLSGGAGIDEASV